MPSNHRLKLTAHLAKILSARSLVLNFINMVTYYTLPNTLFRGMVVAKEGCLHAEKKPVPDPPFVRREERTGTTCGKVYVTVFSRTTGQDDPACGGRMGQR